MIMSKKEELAIEYTDCLMNTSRPYHVETYGLSEAKKIPTFDAYYIEGAYKAGWDAAMIELSNNSELEKATNYAKQKMAEAFDCVVKDYKEKINDLLKGE